MKERAKKILVFICVVSCSWACQEKRVDFSTQVKPILNKKCISCHGGVKRSANFSVLFRKEALDTTESGKFGIIPGDPEHSFACVTKVVSGDDAETLEKIAELYASVVTADVGASNGVIHAIDSVLTPR